MNITSLCFDLRSDTSYQNGLCSLFQVNCLIWSGLIQINRLQDSKRKEETSRKIIIGGMMVSLAKKDKTIANQLLNLIEKNITREADKKRIQPLIDELK